MYYVYAYVRDDGTPYYIGKGTGSRAWSKNHPGIGVPKDTSKIKMLAESISENEAHNLEKELIGKYGRKDLGTGILYNRTNGGEGSSGRILRKESIQKIRDKALLQHKNTPSGFNQLVDASKAGQKGGSSKSEAKINASKTNIEKTRAKHINSIWIIHVESGKRKRVKSEHLDEFLQQGYKRGFRI